MAAHLTKDLAKGVCRKFWERSLRFGGGSLRRSFGEVFGLVLLEHSELRWAKSCDSYRRIASESYRCDSNR